MPAKAKTTGKFANLLDAKSVRFFSRRGPDKDSISCASVAVVMRNSEEMKDLFCGYSGRFAWGFSPSLGRQSVGFIDADRYALDGRRIWKGPFRLSLEDMDEIQFIYGAEAKKVIATLRR